MASFDFKCKVCSYESYIFSGSKGAAVLTLRDRGWKGDGHNKWRCPECVKMRKFLPKTTQHPTLLILPNEDKVLKCSNCERSDAFGNIWSSGGDGYVTVTCRHCGLIQNFHPMEDLDDDELSACSVGYIDDEGDSDE